ncbi:hypothetical protein FHU38_004988 [Saccharomonospora amisosensis]|uniref:DUF3558 domain-containing protein n=1 Tax=Saccharomonospora amisosensis TaxID=1128677 RepID=A0A7X5UVI7_9PSEU|nr:DUF3558 domain-containing protein [Saccharomonospora amisosensis]NIJ14587.1 hypothetical protein [Saccharomonospora amisosensis]
MPLLVAAFGLAGCSDAESGLASPEDSRPSAHTSVGSSVPTSDSSGSTSRGIDSVDPCSLLTDSEVAAFGKYQEPNARQVGTARGCDWNPVRENAQQKLPLISFSVRDNVGVDGVVDLGTGLQRGEMDSGRGVVRTTTPDHGCLIAMAVGEDARVDVVVGAVEPDKACDIASRIAEIIDPKLPMG